MPGWGGGGVDGGIRPGWWGEGDGGVVSGWGGGGGDGGVGLDGVNDEAKVILSLDVWCSV